MSFQRLPIPTARREAERSLTYPSAPTPAVLASSAIVPAAAPPPPSKVGDDPNYGSRLRWARLVKIAIEYDRDSELAMQISSRALQTAAPIGRWECLAGELIRFESRGASTSVLLSPIATPEGLAQSRAQARTFWTALIDELERAAPMLQPAAELVAQALAKPGAEFIGDELETLIGSLGQQRAIGSAFLTAVTFEAQAEGVCCGAVALACHDAVISDQRRYGNPRVDELLNAMLTRQRQFEGLGRAVPQLQEFASRLEALRERVEQIDLAWAEAQRREEERVAEEPARRERARLAAQEQRMAELRIAGARWRRQEQAMRDAAAALAAARSRPKADPGTAQEAVRK